VNLQLVVTYFQFPIQVCFRCSVTNTSVTVTDTLRVLIIVMIKRRQKAGGRAVAPVRRQVSGDSVDDAGANDSSVQLVTQVESDLPQ